jgi:acetylornithine deacetylase
MSETPRIETPQIETPESMIARLVAFDTTSANSNLALIAFVQEYLAGFGARIVLDRNPAGDKANLYASLGPDGPGGIVLSGHTDVVPVAGQSWDGDPFTMVERNGRLHGRGTADMKGFIGTALALVPRFLARPLRSPLHFALSFDEELGCQGVPSLIHRLMRELPRPKLVIVGEPTGMQIANAHKGVYGFATTVTGLEGHSSAPDRAASAVVAAARLINFLTELSDELKRDGAGDPAFDPPHTTLNVGLVRGGTAVNIVPRQCVFHWEFRPLPSADAGAIRARFDRFAEGTVLAALRRMAPDANIETRPTCVVPPLRPLSESPAETLVRHLTGLNTVGAVAFATEAGLFQEAGIPAVVCGPGSIDQAHRPNEYIERAQVDACAAFLARLADWMQANAP